MHMPHKILGEIANVYLLSNKINQAAMKNLYKYH